MSYFGSVWNGYTNWWEFNAKALTGEGWDSKATGVVVGAVSSILAFVPGLPVTIGISILAGLIDLCKAIYNCLPSFPKTYGFGSVMVEKGVPANPPILR